MYQSSTSSLKIDFVDNTTVIFSYSYWYIMSLIMCIDRNKPNRIIFPRFFRLLSSSSTPSLASIRYILHKKDFCIEDRLWTDTWTSSVTEFRKNDSVLFAKYMWLLFSVVTRQIDRKKCCTDDHRIHHENEFDIPWWDRRHSHHLYTLHKTNTWQWWILVFLLF